jgi:hypothetical protein
MSRVTAEEAPTAAINHPVKRAYKRREIHSAELPLRQIADIEHEFKPEIIIAENLAEKSQLDELKFNEEMVTIYLHRGREKFAPQIIDVYCNGEPHWIPVEREYKLKRKFVEILARSQPIDVRTESHMMENSQEASTVNRIHRSVSANYSFSVRHDPNPKGNDWLMKIMREA